MARNSYIRFKGDRLTMKDSISSKVYVIKENLLLNDTTVKPEFVGEIINEGQKLSVGSI